MGIYFIGTSIFVGVNELSYNQSNLLLVNLLISIMQVLAWGHLYMLDHVS